MQVSLFRAVCASQFVVATGVSSAQTIVDEWASVKAPPAPALKDGVSASDTFTEQYVAGHMTDAPAVSANTTLTSPGLLKF